jgi:deoxyribose-phosphate aldolase
MVINRGVCTLIGIFIVLVGDYFLFQTYKYSQKLYLFHQMTVYNFFKNAVQKITQSSKEQINTIIFIEKLRGEIIKHCSPITISAQNLKLEFKISLQNKERVDVFQETIQEIRRIIFALCVSKFILESTTATEKNLQQFNMLMKKARSNFIYIENILDTPII